MKNILLLCGLALACTMACAATPAGKQPAQPAAKPHAAEAQQEVALDDLGKYIGKRVFVHTKFNTTRSGVLTRRSKTEADLKLDSGADLTIPLESIKRVTVPIAPPDPLFQKQPESAKPDAAKSTPEKATPQKPGDSSAKKN
jgi:hypothetical protein